jgi:hypothetical protein
MMSKYTNECRGAIYRASIYKYHFNKEGSQVGLSQQFHIQPPTRRITMNTHHITIAAIAASFALSTAFAADVPKYCKDEIVNLSKRDGFDMQTFAGGLPSAVAKAKAQAKMPFGKPSDSDKTDIGMSFGCLRAFPESPGEIQSLLKDVGQRAARDAVADQYSPPQQARSQYQYPSSAQSCPKCECNCSCGSQADNFTAGERWGTWALNMLIPGLGSAAIMNDYAGMGIQLGLVGFGILSITTLGWSQYEDHYPYSYQCGNYWNGSSYQSNWCNGYNTSTYERENPFFYIGFVSLGANVIFNIARSNSYNKPIATGRRYSSNDYSGFNLAVLPNKRGEAMPYLMYNKTF